MPPRASPRAPPTCGRSERHADQPTLRWQGHCALERLWCTQVARWQGESLSEALRGDGKGNRWQLAMASAEALSGDQGPSVTFSHRPSATIGCHRWPSVAIGGSHRRTGGETGRRIATRARRGSRIAHWSAEAAPAQRARKPSPCVLRAPPDRAPANPRGGKAIKGRARGIEREIERPSKGVHRAFRRG